MSLPDKIIDFSTNPFWMDRNFIYNYDLYIMNDDEAFSYQFVTFCAFLIQNQTTDLFGRKPYLTFTATDIARFTKRTKADILSRAEGFKHIITLPNGKTLELQSRLDKVLHHFAHHPIDLSIIYAYKTKESKHFKEAISNMMVSAKKPTFLDDYIVSIKNTKSGERSYGIVINPIFRDSLVRENLTFYLQDMHLFKGKNSPARLYNELMKIQNQCEYKGLPSWSIPYYATSDKHVGMKQLSEVHVTNYTPAKNKSREHQRIQQKLNKILKETSLSFSFKVLPNDAYAFQFNSKSKQIVPEKQTALLIHNVIFGVYADYFRLNDTKPKDLDELQKKQLLDIIVNHFDSNKRSPGYTTAFINSVITQADLFSNDEVKSAITTFIHQKHQQKSLS